MVSDGTYDIVSDEIVSGGIVSDEVVPEWYIWRIDGWWMDIWVHFFAISKAQQLAIEGHLLATLSYRHGQKNLAGNHRENQPVRCAHQQNYKP